MKEELFSPLADRVTSLLLTTIAFLANMILPDALGAAGEILALMDTCMYWGGGAEPVGFPSVQIPWHRRLSCDGPLPLL